MELNNDFRVGVDRDTTWKVLTDLERIAPLLPGAQLQEIEGDEYRGIVKVKVGPIQAQYKGTAVLIETDESAGRMVMKASGRDTRGQGNASATITLTMTADGTGTKVTTSTDLTISGKVAQFGRGVLADVSGKLITQFVTNLEKDLNAGDKASAVPVEGKPSQASGAPLVGGAAKAGTNGSTGASETASGPVAPGTTAPSTTAPSTTAPSTTASDTTGATSSSAAATSSSGPRKINSPEPEPVYLFDTAGNTVAKRVAPLAGAALLIFVAVLLRRRRRTTRSSRAVAKVTSTFHDVRSHVPTNLLPDHEAVVRAGRKAGKKAVKQGRKAALRAQQRAIKAR